MDNMFGPNLDKILEQATDRKRGFPEDKFGNRKLFFRKQQQYSRPDRGRSGGRNYTRGNKGKSFLFNPNKGDPSSSKQ